MAEPTLALGYSDFAAAVGEYLDYSYDSADWTAAQTAEIDRDVQDGIRQVYGPPAIVRDQREYVHQWSFLRPVTTLAAWASVAVDAAVTVTGVHAAGTTTITAAGGTPFRPSMIGESLVITGIGTFTITGYTSTTVIAVSGNATCAGATFSITADGNYRLPDDFGAMIDPLTFAPGSGYGRIPLVGESQIRTERMYYSTSGVPRVGAVRPAAAPTATAGQRFELMLFPIPDAEYTLSYAYHVALNKLSASNPYPYGGALHGQLYLASCLAMAELKRDDRQGERFASFMRALRGSVEIDLEQARSYFGKNLDTSDDRYRNFTGARVDSTLVTYNGVPI